MLIRLFWIGGNQITRYYSAGNDEGTPSPAVDWLEPATEEKGQTYTDLPPGEKVTEREMKC